MFIICTSEAYWTEVYFYNIIYKLINKNTIQEYSDHYQSTGFAYLVLLKCTVPFLPVQIIIKRKEIFTCYYNHM